MPLLTILVALPAKSDHRKMQNCSSKAFSLTVNASFTNKITTFAAPKGIKDLEFKIKGLKKHNEKH